MSDKLPKFRIAYYSHPSHPAFLDAIGQDPALELVRITPGLPEDAAIKILTSCQGYFVRAARDELPRALHLTADLIARLPRLLVAVSYGAGYDTIDPIACEAAGILVVNQAGGNAKAVAEHAVGMMLALLRNIPAADTALRMGSVRRREDYLGRELHGRTVGIVGLGHTGGAVSRILAMAFECNVLAVDPYVDAATCLARGASKIELSELLAESEIVSLHCPLTSDTRGLFGGRAFAQMRAGAIFITTARGGVHDEDALYEALREGHLAGAGLDVWGTEPPHAAHPLLQLPNVIATPHIAGVTAESRERVARMAAAAFSECAAGNLPPRIVNPDVIERYTARRAENAGANSVRSGPAGDDFHGIGLKRSRTIGHRAVPSVLPPER